MPNALSAIAHRAKMIVRTQGGTYQQALKKAGMEYREKKGKVSGARRIGKKKKKVGTTYHPVSVEHCAPAGGSIMGAVSKAKNAIKSRLGWLMATRATARTEREKRKLDPKIADLKRKLRALE